MQNNLDNEVEKTLNSLDNISRANAPDRLYEKLEARLNFTTQISNKWFNLLKIGAAAMIVMSVLNGYIILQNDSQEISTIEDFSTEYFDSNTSILNY